MSKYKKIQPILNGAGFTLAPFNHIYIYQITLNSSSQYYIGQTDDVKRRLYRHFICIKNTIKGTETMPLPFHEIIANNIKKRKGVMFDSEIEQAIISSISFKILFVADSKKNADVYEYNYIDINKNDDCCLNKRFS